MPHFKVKSEAYAAIEARFRCDHERRELRLRIIAAKRPVYYRQCIRCGNAGRAIAVRDAKLAIQAGTDAPPFDDDLEYKWLAEKHAEYVRTYQDIAPRMNAEYEAYLRSDDWAVRRASTLERANHVCQVCEHFQATQVHHIHYERIGAELDSDLMAVCFFCHGLLHGRKEL